MRMYINRAFVLSVLVCLSTSAFGLNTQEWNLASSYQAKCSSGNQLENNNCLSFEYKAADLRLNELYKILVNALADPKPLINSQRAWLKFRDAQCKFIVGEDKSGSGYSYSEDTCMIDLIEKRILDLKSIEPCNGCVLFKDEYYENGKWPPP